MLIDRYNRHIDYLRISVTDRCNLRCIYCMPPEGVKNIPHGEILRYEEIIEVIQTARQLGFRRFRITGGEPLIRKGILEFLESLKTLGISFSLTTNGILLEEYAKELALNRSGTGLAQVGLSRLNISLDSLQKQKFYQITRGGILSKVLEGIELARKQSFSPIKINTVIMNGINEDEIDNFIHWAKMNELNIRFIEFMPVRRGEDLFCPLQGIMEELIQKNDLVPTEIPGSGPARNFQFRNSKGSVSFILPRSQPFCYQCNRLRLTADGKLRPCFASETEIEIKSILRQNHTEQDIASLIKKAVALKPKGHNFKFTSLMSRVGG